MSLSIRRCAALLRHILVALAASTPVVGFAADDCGDEADDSDYASDEDDEPADDAEEEEEE